MILKPMLENVSFNPSEQILNLNEIGSRCVHIAAAIAHFRCVVVFVTDRKEAEIYLLYLKSMGITDTVYYPTPSLSPYEWTGEERPSSQQRHTIRHRLLDSDQPPQCLLMSYQAPTHLMMDNSTWYRASINLFPQDKISPLELVQNLIQLGYEPSNWITERGQFTRRGSVIDIYSVGSDAVLRLEWFDDEIDKIWTYRLNDTQNKPREETKATILPAYEWVIPSDIQHLKVKLQENHRGNFVQYLKEFRYQPDLYQIMSFFHPVSSIFSSLPEKSLLIWPDGLWHKAKGYAHMLDETAANRKIEAQHLSLEQLKSESNRFRQQFLHGHDSQQKGALLPTIEHDLNLMSRKLKDLLHQEYHVSIVSTQPQRLLSILQERDVPVSTQTQAIKGHLHLIQGNLPAGFAYSPNKWLCFTDKEIFQSENRITQKKKFRRPTSPVQLSQLKENMLVVHDVHGIGRYQGLVQYSTTGETREYLSVQYAGSDKLLVPVEQMHRLQIYHGVSGESTKLHKLGGSEWEKAKSKVKKNLVEIAEALLKTEAARMQAEGIAFPMDTEWQREMEFAFPYEETPDQLQAIVDTKADMESAQVMNRLICGDVGFGKTEVALRAAFKAAISGYQVAILAPTTILAHQHYQILKDRFAPYPLRVELLSRYRSQKESDQLFTELAAGAVDIVVATHRLLSKKLSFKKLGLLIIDEEHRFGVGQKEKLKDLAPHIDILTMSATPIPRTLNIALGGLKSLSLIETPPPNRKSIQTQVHPYDEDLIKKAIYQELQRDGQIYYIHNRVKSIYEVGGRIRELVPQARIRVAHGQMSKQELEETMWAFYHHEFDILVCTTIVESGLDISNVNTLIIEDVELLGLAQIHQLRGRVGRSNIQAYAYLFHDLHKPLTKEARERLTVVQEYSELGSGYFLALKDMEIRGIGNIIGPQQHGNIVTVGFETYCQLLEEAILSLQGQDGPQREYTACVVDLNLPAYLPDSWLKDGNEKLRVYRSLAYANDLEYVEQLAKDLEKKYGSLPESAEILWRVTRIRILGNYFHIEKIAYNGPLLELKGKIDHNLLILTQRKFPELKTWKHQEERLIHPKAPKPEHNLLGIEQLLDSLYKISQKESMEFEYVP